MGNLLKQDAVNMVNSVIRVQCNSGITWGTDARHPDMPMAWFGGPRAGIANEVFVNAFDGFPSPNAQKMLDVIHYFIGPFAAIRLARIYLAYKFNNPTGYDGNGRRHIGPTQYRVDLDQTAIGNFNPETTGLTSGITTPVSPTIAALTNVSGQAVLNYCQGMVDKYNTLCRTNVQLYLENISCHQSCHESCYASRSRR